MVTGALCVQAAKAQFKVVGYIRNTGSMVRDMQAIDLGKVTHLNVAFINPDTLGNFRDIASLDTVVRIAHARNVKVLLSCGGGSRQAYYHKLLSAPYRPQLVANFIAFADKYKLDGIDIDLEGDDIDEYYESFITELRPALTQRNMLLTAAVAYYTRKRITDKALNSFDFINMMAYDKTGPWRLTDPTQHSPLSYAQDHLSYWRKERGLSKDKLVIGVPFYGYGFGPLPDTNRLFRSMVYKDIIAQFPGAEQRDEVSLPGNGGTVFYNGKPTIRKKTELAVKNGGGIMIWHLMADTGDDNSLLKVIHETAYAKKKK